MGGGGAGSLGGGGGGGEGSFFVNIFKSSHYKVGYLVRLIFEIARSPTVVRSATQHIRDELLMASLLLSSTVESSADTMKTW